MIARFVNRVLMARDRRGVPDGLGGNGNRRGRVFPFQGEYDDDQVDESSTARLDGGRSVVGDDLGVRLLREFEFPQINHNCNPNCCVMLSHIDGNGGE